MKAALLHDNDGLRTFGSYWIAARIDRR